MNKIAKLCLIFIVLGLILSRFFGSTGNKIAYGLWIGTGAVSFICVIIMIIKESKE